VQTYLLGILDKSVVDTRHMAHHTTICIKIQN